MENNYLYLFIKALESEDLHEKATAHLNSFPLAPSVGKKISELNEQLEKFHSMEGINSIQNEIDGWIDWGSRLRPSKRSGDGDVELEEVDVNTLLDEFYLREVSKIIDEFCKGFRASMDRIKYLGLSNTKKVEEFQKQLDELNDIILRFSRRKIGSEETWLMIINTLQSKILDLVERLNGLGLPTFPKYDYEKLKEYIHNPFEAKPKEGPELFQGVQNNWKGDSYYLFTPHEEKASDKKSINIEKVENEEVDQDYEEFKTNNKRLFDLELKNKRVFDDKSFKELYKVLMSFKESPVALPKEQRIKLNYPTGCKMEMLGALLDCIFQSKYFQRDREEFNNFVTGCLLDRGGKEITSTSSIRRKPNS